MEKSSVIPCGRIENSILLIRGQKVMLDEDLAGLYGVETKRLNEQVTRNLERFPKDFMFRLTKGEDEILRSQIVTPKREERGILKSQIATSSWGGRRRSLPRVFTEQGVAMLSSVLKSKRAVAVNIEIMRAFVKLRRILATHKDLAYKLDEPEKKYDTQFKVVFDAIRRLMMPPPESEKRAIGFKVEDD